MTSGVKEALGLEAQRRDRRLPLSRHAAGRTPIPPDEPGVKEFMREWSAPAA